MVLSIEERVIIVEYVFREGNRYPRARRILLHLTYLWGTAKSAVHRDRPLTLSEVKTAITAFIKNISQADLQKVFANKIKRVQACIDARGHHFQHLL
jgi:hypothetical protein